jgi:hypothetical protein
MAKGGCSNLLGGFSLGFGFDFVAGLVKGRADNEAGIRLSVKAAVCNQAEITLHFFVCRRRGQRPDSN